MSETVAGLIAFLFYLVFLLLFGLLWWKAKLGGNSVLVIAREAFKIYRNGYRLFALFLLSVAFARAIFGTGLVALAIAGFVCIGAVFGLGLQTLQVLRQILLEFYAFIEKIIKSPTGITPVRQ